MATAGWGNKRWINVPCSLGLTAPRIDINSPLVSKGDLYVHATQYLQILANRIKVGRHLHLSSGGAFYLGAKQTRSHRENRPHKRSTCVQDVLTNHKFRIEAGGNVELQAGGSMEWEGLDIAAGGNITVRARDLKAKNLLNQTSTNTTIRRKGHLFRSKKTKTIQEVRQDVVRNRLTADGHIFISTVGDLHLQAPLLKSGGGVTFESETGAIFVDVAKGFHSACQTIKSKSLVWQSLKNKGHEDELTALMQLCAVGGVSFRAPHVVVEVPFSKDRSPYLPQDPLLNWMKSLQNNSHVTWKGVNEEHKQWSHKSQGMTMGAQVLLTIAMSVVTGGVGGTLIGATAGSLQAALASSFFTSLVSQTAVSLINNQGNLSRVLKEMSSSKTLISLATSTVTAGISHAFGPSSLDTLTNHLHNAGVQCIPVTTVSVLRNPDMKQALKQGLLDIGVSFAGSYGAKNIGDMRHSIDFKAPSINWLLPNVLHGILGAAMGTALSEDWKNGAFSGMLGAVAAETIAEQITPSPQAFYKSLLAKGLKEGRILSQTEMLDLHLHLHALQLYANIARMTTGTILLLAKKDVAIGDITGSNALQNNSSSTFASEFSKYAYQYAEDHPEEMEKLNQRVSEVEEKVEETLSTEVEFFSHQKKRNLSRINKNINILSEENQQKYPLPNYAKENWAQLRKYQQEMRIIEENRTTTVGGLTGEVLFQGGLLFLPMGRVANWVGTGLKGAKEILIKTPYGKEIINFSKPFVKKGIQLFEKTRNRVFPSVNKGGTSSVKNFMPHPFSRTMEALDLGSTSTTTFKLRYLPVSKQQVNGLKNDRSNTRAIHSFIELEYATPEAYSLRIDPITRKGPMSIDSRLFTNTKPTTKLGAPKNPVQFWQLWEEKYPGMLSAKNLEYISNKKSPYVDSHWLKYFPEHQNYMGGKLEHHHIDYGFLTVPLPKKLHRGEGNISIRHNNKMEKK
jgi:hypothetical protein